MAAKQSLSSRAVKEEQQLTYQNQPRKANGRFVSSGGRKSSSVHEPPPAKRGRAPTASKVPKREPTEAVLLPALQPPEHTADLMKRLVAAYVEEKAKVNGKKPPKRPSAFVSFIFFIDCSFAELQPASKKLKSRRMSKSGRLHIPTAKMKSAMNGRSNGTSHSLYDDLTDDEDEEAVPELNGTMLEALGTALAECVLPTTLDANKTAGSESDLSVDHEEAPVENGGLANMENYELINLNLGTKSGMDLSDLVCPSLPFQSCETGCLGRGFDRASEGPTTTGDADQDDGPHSAEGETRAGSRTCSLGDEQGAEPCGR